MERVVPFLGGGWVALLMQSTQSEHETRSPQLWVHIAGLLPGVVPKSCGECPGSVEKELKHPMLMSSAAQSARRPGS